MSDKDLSVTTTANPETMADNTCIYNNNFFTQKSMKTKLGAASRQRNQPISKSISSIPLNMFKKYNNKTYKSLSSLKNLSL